MDNTAASNSRGCLLLRCLFREPAWTTASPGPLPAVMPGCCCSCRFAIFLASAKRASVVAAEAAAAATKPTAAWYCNLAPSGCLFAGAPLFAKRSAVPEPFFCHHVPFPFARSVLEVWARHFVTSKSSLKRGEEGSQHVGSCVCAFAGKRAHAHPPSNRWCLCRRSGSASAVDNER